MVRNLLLMNNLKKKLIQLNESEREYISLRVEFMLMQIESTLSAQYRHVMTLPNCDALLVQIGEGITSCETFRRWFQDVVSTSKKFTLEHYLKQNVGVSQNETKTVMKVLSKIMLLLPRWVNYDVAGCFCSKPHVLQELHDGYRFSILQGSKKVFTDLDAEDVRNCTASVVQLPLDPGQPMQATVYIQLNRRGRRLFNLFSQRNRKVFFDESFDPVALLGFEGSLLGKGDIEMPIAVRLWPTPDCEALYQDLVSDSTQSSSATANSSGTASSRRLN